jgi:hypothetical protein
MPTDLAHPVGVFPPTGWIQAQRGVGAYATCENCNSFSGAEYVPSYTDFVASLLNALQEWAETMPDDEPPKTLSFTMSRGRPGDVVRQALFMILATSGSLASASATPCCETSCSTRPLRRSRRR